MLKKIMKISLYICAGILLILFIAVAGLSVYLARPVWKSHQIPFVAKIRITLSSGLACPTRVYIVQPDRRNTFFIL